MILDGRARNIEGLSHNDFSPSIRKKVAWFGLALALGYPLINGRPAQDPESPSGDSPSLSTASSLPGSRKVSSQNRKDETPSHPLDSLTKEDVEKLKKILGERPSSIADDLVFASVVLKEPSKSEVLDFELGKSFSRHVALSCFSPKRKKAFEIVVDVNNSKIISTTELVDSQPPFTSFDSTTALKVIDGSPLVRKLLEARGIDLKGKKPSDVLQVDVVAPGRDPWVNSFRIDGRQPRIVRVLFEDDKNVPLPTGPFLEGLEFLVDVFDSKILKIINKPSPRAPADMGPSSWPRKSTIQNLSDLKVEKGIENKNIKLENNHVQWNNWDFRYSFNAREGLVLHQIKFRDLGVLRPICYRASISELLVPYGDGSWREFLDEGEYGLGTSSTALRAGVELPADAVSLPVMLPGENLEANILENRVFFYEQDQGLVLFHNMESEQGQSRLVQRPKQLVTGFMVTLGNYDYLVQWVFRADGSFGAKVSLLGFILTKSTGDEVCETCVNQRIGQSEKFSQTRTSAPLVAKNRLGMLHQHWFNIRLDWDIDGSSNAVKEHNIHRLPSGENNPLDRSFAIDTKILSNESEAMRNSEDGRSWTVFNPNKSSYLGHFPGYMIDLKRSPHSWIVPSRSREPQSFSQRDLWVTQYNNQELHASGKYPMQKFHSGKPDGLISYVSDKQAIFNTDLVTWINIGITHLPTPEEFPAMPKHEAMVDFRPVGFFNGTPALEKSRLQINRK